MRSVLLLPCLFLVTSARSSADPDGIRFYESKIRPLFADQCASCHSSKLAKTKGGLSLDGKADWLKGGGSGPAVVPGNAELSLLIKAVRRNHADVAAMPPKKELSREQITDLTTWVNSGAAAPEETTAKQREEIAEAKKRWPFTPVPTTVHVPKVKTGDGATTDIDRFIAAKLESKGLVPVGRADKRTLLRRVTFDLIGLPPTPDEIQSFLADESPVAWETVIDRLLASPHYGERWGRHWLDVVRYADTAGDNSDFPIPQHYRYRNWVIDAINRDLPYDQFVREQLAGDLMGGASEAERHARIVATGYLANARRFGSRVDDYPQHLTIEDTLDNLGRAFLGLSMNCARCHDHKFDPLDMTDYYGLYGILNSTRYPWPGIELEQRQRDLVPLVPAAEAEAVLAERNRKNDEFQAQLKTLYAAKSKAADDKAKLAEVQKRIDEVQKEQRKAVNAALPFPTAYAVAEGKKRENVAVQLKGDPTKPGNVVPRHFPTVLGGFELPADDPTSGRLALANWITAADNPLTARVIVNRVWHHHFGRGLVPTPNDFGKQGTPPTHPELLDYLAGQFVREGWSLKKLHKRLLLTQTYQRASTGEVAGAATADPTNELLGRFRQRRLDAEAIRDSLLAVSGQLDRTPGQAHPFPDPTTWNFTQHNPFRAVYETNRRSVYLMTQRIQRHPYLAVFDGPDTSASTGSRVTSTTTLQALFFLNDEFVHARAKGLAARTLAARSGTSERIGWVTEVLFGRTPTAAEVSRGEEYVRAAERLVGGDHRESDAWASYIRSLLRLNEFVYVD